MIAYQKLMNDLAKLRLRISQMELDEFEGGCPSKAQWGEILSKLNEAIAGPVRTAIEDSVRGDMPPVVDKRALRTLTSQIKGARSELSISKLLKDAKDGGRDKAEG